MPRQKLPEKTIEQMKALRGKGLSNSKIGIEMGLSTMTVSKYLGPQPKMVRAEYGSILAHARGDSFVNKCLKEKSVIVVLTGRTLSYTITNNQSVEIAHIDTSTGNSVFTADELSNFIDELIEVRSYMCKNQTLLLDGKPKSQEKPRLL